MEYAHLPVLLKETVDLLVTDTDKKYIDCTFGGGGHSREILKRLSGEGGLLAFDCDSEALERGGLLQEEDRRFQLHYGRFSTLRENAEKLHINNIQGILMDIGVSTFQLYDVKRGFSFNSDEPLDMRLDKNRETTAYNVVNEYSENELVEIFKKYTDLGNIYNLASTICKQRFIKPFNTCKELSEFIKTSTKLGRFAKKNVHPATQVFQAIRIEVNNELGELSSGLETSINLLNKGGRLAVITFHSIEDRVVKTFFKREATDCLCDKKQMVCVCGHKKASSW